MNEQSRVELQDHNAFEEGRHDFQADIQAILASDMIRVLLDAVMLATGARFTAVARVTQNRWVACQTLDEACFGLKPGDEIPIWSTFCQSVRDNSQPVIFDDVETDEVYANHPIARQFGIASYASLPIYREDGSFFGTLCAIDRVPRRLRSPRVVAMLRTFAGIIGRAIDTEARLDVQSKLALHERRMAQAQEEFLAVLGHDLRNPIAALSAGLRQLERDPREANLASLLPLMHQSVHRMEELSKNMMLHARSRLGGGIRIDATPGADLAEAVRHVVEEMRAARPDHSFELAWECTRPIVADASRIAQAVSNLVANAAQHGDAGHPIVVRAGDVEAGLRISVSNRGPAIPDALREALFKPFHRGSHARGDGLGLGLYIASSICAAHGGRMEVDCRDGITTFSITLPERHEPATPLVQAGAG